MAISVRWMKQALGGLRRTAANFGQAISAMRGVYDLGALKGTGETYCGHEVKDVFNSRSGSKRADADEERLYSVRQPASRCRER